MLGRDVHLEIQAGARRQANTVWVWMGAWVALSQGVFLHEDTTSCVLEATPLFQNWLAYLPSPGGCLDIPRTPRQGATVCGMHAILGLF